MPFYGSIVVIKRSGADGSTFPLINEVMLILVFVVSVKLTDLLYISRSVCWAVTRVAISASSFPSLARSTPSSRSRCRMER